MGVMPQLSANFPLLPPISATGITAVSPSSVFSASSSNAPIAVTKALSQAANSGLQIAVPAGMFLGEGLVPLPEKLVQRIINLEFVEMSELMPESWLAAEGGDVDVSGQTKVVSLFPRRRRAPVTDIMVWVQCFAAMVGVLSTKHPDKVPEFMAYLSLIVKCSRDYEGYGWVLYDRAFRRQVAVTKDLHWSKLNPTLHSLCMVGKAVRTSFALCVSAITILRSSVQTCGRECFLPGNLISSGLHQLHSIPLQGPYKGQYHLATPWDTPLPSRHKFAGYSTSQKALGALSLHASSHMYASFAKGLMRKWSVG